MEKELRRVGLVGDVHAEDEILATALAFLRGIAALDALLCSGDIMTGKGDAGRCCDWLHANGVWAVRGNHDRWALDHPTAYEEKTVNATPRAALTLLQRAFLSDLPPTRTWATPRGPLLQCHGMGEDDMSGVYPNDGPLFLEANHNLRRLIAEDYFRVVVAGHTHHRMARTVEELTLINAGTLRRDHRPCCAVADFEAGSVQFYDIEPATLAVSEAEAITL